MRRASKSHWLALLLLLVQWALLLNAATALSATIDEPFHITSGYEYLRTGKLQLFDEHTPVAKALFAWPLFFVPDLAPPESAAGYADGNLISAAQETLLAYRPLDRVIVAPRVAAALLTVLLAGSIYAVARNLAGPEAGLLALALCAFDPNFLAHGSLATTDMGATAFSFWALWAGSRWLKTPARRNWLLAVVLLGLAQGAKLTALLLYPVLGLAVLLNIQISRKDAKVQKGIPTRQFSSIANGLLEFGALVGLSLLVLWALYGFELRPVAGLFGGMPLPAASAIERWLRLQENLAYGREAFLLGQNSMHGWWYYFPVAFLIKTPLPLLLLGGYAVVRGVIATVRSGRKIDASRLVLTLFPLLYAALSLISDLNIGYRHLLPVLPFVYVGIANAACRVPHDLSCSTKRAAQIVHYGLLIWLVIGTLRIAPHQLTFFNELAGGPRNGWRFLADSNTDWGQAYKALAAFQAEEGIETLQVAGFVFYDPAAYGVAYTPLTPLGGNTPAVFPQRFAPPPGDYAISVTTLDGVPLADPEMYDWFRRREPDARIANALFYYHVPSQDELQWSAQCQVPAVPLDNDALLAGLDSLPVRQLEFDCTQAWIIPAVGPGITVLHGEQLRESLASRLLLETPALQDAFVARHLGTASLSYRQRRTQATPSFALYSAGKVNLEGALLYSAGWVAAAETAPQSLQTLPDSQGPFAFQDSLELLGALPYPHSESLEVETWWRVVTVPQSRPLSLMAHLVNGAGETLGIADGLGIAADAWQAGDVVVQRHRFALPQETATTGLLLRTGVYWLDDGARWNVVEEGRSADAVFLPLSATPTP